MSKYYDKPTQVAFLTVNGGARHAGIAYKDEIICLCCGDVLKISEIIDIKELPWESLANAVLGW